MNMELHDTEYLQFLKEHSEFLLEKILARGTEDEDLSQEVSLYNSFSPEDLNIARKRQALKERLVMINKELKTRTAENVNE